MKTLSLSPKQLLNVLKVAIPAKEPILISGAPGIGKSDIVTQAARLCGAEIIISHPVVCDPTDAKGLPWPDNNSGKAKFLPYGDLARAIQAEKLTVWFLDDLGQALPSVQASYMQLILAKRIGEHILPPCVTFIAATNRRGDKAGVSGILEPVKSRFSSIIELETKLEDWVEWAIHHDVRPEVIAFLRFRPDLLHAFNPSQDMVNSPCPRTWASLSRLMNLGIPSDSEMAVYSGAIGESAAIEFISFVRLCRDMPDPDMVLKNPKSAPIPENLSVLCALCAALAYRCSVKTIGNILRYAERLEKEHAEFGVLILRDSYVRCPDIGNTKEFLEFISSSKIGKFIYEK